LNSRCIGCHSGNTPSGGLSLEAAKSFGSLTTGKSTCSNKTFVVSGNAAQSYVVEKVESATPTCGARMPRGGTLTTAEITLIKNWICQGAKNN